KSISIDQKMIINQKADMVKQAMARISPKYREILEHRYYDDLSYEEISERMELPIGTVKVHLNRAKSMLERILVTLKQTYKQDLDEIY
nr:sigma-70 family RNA polymerase sigma factor [Chitinophagales bacterium]